MKYSETDKMIRLIETALIEKFENSDFKLMNITSIQITENKKGLISVTPTIKFIRH
jgi:hypothetical protein